MVVQRIRIIYAKEGLIRFISHLDLVRTLRRAIRRAKIPVAYTGGFNPRPRITFCPPLPLGVTGRAEPAEIFLEKEVVIDQLCESLREQLPEGLTLEKATVVPLEEKSLAGSINGACYRIKVNSTCNKEQKISSLINRIDWLKQEREVIVKRKKGKEDVHLDIKPQVKQLTLVEKNPLVFEVYLGLGVRLRELLLILLGEDVYRQGIIGVERTKFLLN